MYLALGLEFLIKENVPANIRFVCTKSSSLWVDKTTLSALKVSLYLSTQ